MDKLKPILAQKFWILLGVGLIVSFVGWSMASGAMSKAIDERIGKIKTARDNAGKGDAPNETWQAALANINEQQSVLVDAAKYKLWQEETAVMEWPESMIPYLRKATAYRGDMNDPVAPTVYRNDYPRAFEGVWKTVRPMIPYDPNGIVAFPMANMKPYRSWGSLTPTYQEIWEAQEDLWLFKALLKSILVVNGGEEGTKLDASIHAIQRLELMGGDRSTIGASAAGSDGGMGGMPGMGMEDGGAAGGLMGAGAMPGGPMGGGFGGGGPGGGDAMGGGQVRVSADFDPTEEFGSPGGGAGAGDMSGMGGMMSAMAGAEGDGGAGMGGGQTASPPRRYIDDDENQPYQTRGFYLSVLMDHRRVPNLLCELTANEYSPFPVEIVRVQIARLNDDSPGGSQLQMGTAGGLAGSPFSGGGLPGGLPGGFPGAEVGLAEDAGAGLAGLAGATGPMPEGGFGGMPGGGGRVGGPDPYLADPFMAQVAIAGIMKIYRKASPPVAPGSANPAPAPEAVPASVAEEPPATTPAEGTPAEGTPTEGAAPGQPAPAPANGAAPASPPAAPAAGTPAAPPASPPPASSPPAADAPPPK